MSASLSKVTLTGIWLYTVLMTILLCIKDIWSILEGSYLGPPSSSPSPSVISLSLLLFTLDVLMTLSWNHTGTSSSSCLDTHSHSPSLLPPSFSVLPHHCFPIHSLQNASETSVRRRFPIPKWVQNIPSVFK